jgi:hypothetical protein
MGVGRYEKWAPYTVNSQTLTANDHFVNFVSPGTDSGSGIQLLKLCENPSAERPSSNDMESQQGYLFVFIFSYSMI